MKKILVALLCVAPAVANAQIMTTIAGNGTMGYSTDGIAATAAELNKPFGMAADISGNVYIADVGNNRIRKVSASDKLFIPGNTMIHT